VVDEGDRLRGFPEKMIPAVVFTPTKPKDISHGKTRKNTENFSFSVWFRVFPWPVSGMVINARINHLIPPQRLESGQRRQTGSLRAQDAWP
jgi:hypothetical protein